MDLPAGAGAGDGREPGRAGFERACRLPNTVHSEIAAALPLPTLPATLGTDLYDHDEPLAEPDRPDMIMQAAAIARILASTDISHLLVTLPFSLAAPAGNFAPLSSIFMSTTQGLRGSGSRRGGSQRVLLALEGGAQAQPRRLQVQAPHSPTSSFAR